MHDLFGTQTTLSYVENGAHKVVFILVVAPLLALTEPTDEISLGGFVRVTQHIFLLSINLVHLK